MAIAFDAATAQTQTSGTSSQTFSHTCTGSNLILLVGVTVWNTGDIVTGITYNGVAMTRLTRYVPSAAFNPVYLYYLLGPATGANNVVVSLSTNALIQGISVSYTGVKQTGFPDAWGQDFIDPGTSKAYSVTTVANNCWVGLRAMNNQGALSAGANTTLRTTGGSDVAFLDNNAAKTPAGSVTLNTSWTPSGIGNGIIFSMEPAAAAAASTRRLGLLGVGQ